MTAPAPRDIRDVLARLAGGAPLEPDTARAAFGFLMDGEADDAQIAAFLMALRVRGETIEDIVAGAEVLRSRVATVPAPEDVVDTCGTGGDGGATFNISTAAALIAAGAGAKIAKHGNRAVSSKSGSSEVLAALGVGVDAPPEVVGRCIAEAGIGFLYAPAHHGAMKHVAAARRSLGLRTIFNLIGPLTNPARAKRQVLGVYAKDLLWPMAGALARLGAVSAWVVHARDGLDELSTTAPTDVVVLRHGNLEDFTLDATEVGLPRARLEDLAGGDPSENAAILRAILDGAPGPKADIAVLNAAAALVVADVATSLGQGVALARDAIGSGRARAALDRLVTLSRSRDAA